MFFECFLVLMLMFHCLQIIDGLKFLGAFSWIDFALAIFAIISCTLLEFFRKKIREENAESATVSA